ncbi:Cyclin-like F-box [Cordyceps militaris CM01]|uniref:Cyclin-like F-box n=1 Tax=Cordyceps militaris (strain CM01) TaxID=983644 RepID=G3JST3_CORMM|nr:Cyclin-like F-box [Cordyceps militaris CM01]EGX88929.1 Cyclin-like F-box [Cordyceps militaris CM01]
MDSDLSLSSRLPPNRTTRFRWQDGAVLDIRADVGALRVLPLETIHAILQQLDLASLHRLENVSRGMRRAVASLPQLQAVAQCAPDAVRAIWAARVSHLIACGDLYTQLCRPACVFCNFRPGEYLYLLACHRVCRKCLLGQSRYKPLRPSEARRAGLRVHEVRRLPRLRVPKYSQRARGLRTSGKIRQRNTTGWLLLDFEAVVREIGRVRYTKRWTEAAVASLFQRQPSSEVLPYKPEYAYSASVLLPWLDRSTQNVGRPELCRACRFAAQTAPSAAQVTPQRAPCQSWYHCGTQQGLKDHIGRHGAIKDGLHVKVAV